LVSERPRSPATFAACRRGAVLVVQAVPVVPVVPVVQIAVRLARRRTLCKGILLPAAKKVEPHFRDLFARPDRAT